MPPDACRNPLEDDSIGNNNYNKSIMLLSPQEGRNLNSRLHKLNIVEPHL